VIPVNLQIPALEAAMMAWRGEQWSLFYQFRLDERVEAALPFVSPHPFFRAAAAGPVDQRPLASPPDVRSRRSPT
jgi:hypothetical protein